MKKILAFILVSVTLFGCVRRPIDPLENYRAYPVREDLYGQGITFNKLIEDTIKEEKSPLIEKGKEFLRNGKIQLATTTFNQVLKKNPRDLYAKMGIGIIAISQKKFNEASSLFQDIVASDPSSSVGLAYSAWIRILTKKYIEAERYLSTFRIIYTNTAIAHFLDAWVLRQKEDFVEAERSYNLSIIAEPRFRDAYFDLATLLKEQGREKESEELFYATLDLTPDFLESNKQLADIYLHSARYEDAIEKFKKVLSKTPSDQSALLGLCISYAKTDKKAQAINSCKNAAKNETLAIYYLADQSQKLGKKSDAIENYKKFIAAAKKKNPKDELIKVAEIELKKLSKR